MENKTVFERRWLMLDFARQRTFVREEVLLMLDMLKRLGYNGVGIYLEGAFSFAYAKGVVRRGAMTREDAKWLVAEAEKRGIFVFPMTNVVGHMEHFFSQERYRPMMMEGTENQLNFLDDKAKDFALTILHDLADAFGTGTVHIGGDETTLTEENKMLYAAFLADIAKTLLDEGLSVGIWDDMIWMDLPMVALFDRRVMIFDWSYYGHRPESPRYFKDEGFETVIVCPCDNTWEGIIPYQRLTGYLKAHKDIPVLPYEVEAFFDDAKNEGVYNGMHTNWENAYGRSFWVALTAIARSGLYMQGEIALAEEADEKIEMALFGRITPYSALTHLFQDDIQRKDLDFCWFTLLRQALYDGKHMESLLTKAMKELPSFPEEYEAVLERAEALLASWTPESAFEANCHRAMAAVITTVRAGCAIIKAARGYSLYKEASLLQFSDPEKSEALLLSVAGGFDAAICAVSAHASAFAKAIEGTGHTKADLDRLKDTEHILSLLLSELRLAISLSREVPLPRFELFIRRATHGTPIIR